MKPRAFQQAFDVGGVLLDVGDRGRDVGHREQRHEVGDDRFLVRLRQARTASRELVAWADETANAHSAVAQTRKAPNRTFILKFSVSPGAEFVVSAFGRLDESISLGPFVWPSCHPSLC